MFLNQVVYPLYITLTKMGSVVGLIGTESSVEQITEDLQMMACDRIMRPIPEDIAIFTISGEEELINRIMASP